ncbi:hypothetical protein C8R45DRAFT_1104896 [Mycena sanguinolenta]|nr:hypothetical protein C8R45DRAFT_1104896 [Mycena sanguinolenta]
MSSLSALDSTPFTRCVLLRCARRYWCRLFGINVDTLWVQTSGNGQLFHSRSSSSPTRSRSISASDSDSDAESPKNPRRVVDFDEDEDGWEDVDGQLQGLGTTTDRSRNRARPVIPVRKRRRIVAGPNARATAKQRRSVKGKRMQVFMDDLDQWEMEREERIEALAEKHDMKVKEVRRRMLSASTYKASRNVSLYNAKITRIMDNMNEGRGVGERYTMPQVRRMASKDPSMLQGFTEEEEKEMMAEAVAKWQLRRRGARANNAAAKVDAKRTLDRLFAEITGLAERAGMIGFAFFSRGHIHDKTAPSAIESWGALDFIREILKKDPVDVASLFKLWAVSRERGDTGAETLLAMQKECTAIIKVGLATILGKTKVKMNYMNYIKTFVVGKNIGLVNWPDGVDFKRMSLQSSVGPVRILLNSLKSGITRWKTLTSTKKKQLVDKYDEMLKRGEVEAPKARSKKAQPSRTAAKRAKKAAVEDEGDDDDEEEEEEEEDGEEDEEEEEDEQEKERLRKMTVRARLLELVARGAQKQGRKGGEPREGEAKEGESEGRKKKKTASKGSSARAVDTRSDDDDEGAPVEPRPKPKARYRGAPATTALDGTPTNVPAGTATTTTADAPRRADAQTSAPPPDAPTGSSVKPTAAASAADASEGDVPVPPVKGAGGGRPNMVRGKGKRGPPGVKEWI